MEEATETSRDAAEFGLSFAYPAGLQRQLSKVSDGWGPVEAAVRRVSAGLEHLRFETARVNGVAAVIKPGGSIDLGSLPNGAGENHSPERAGVSFLPVAGPEKASDARSLIVAAAPAFLSSAANAAYPGVDGRGTTTITLGSAGGATRVGSVGIAHNEFAINHSAAPPVASVAASGSWTAAGSVRRSSAAPAVMADIASRTVMTASAEELPTTRPYSSGLDRAAVSVSPVLASGAEARADLRSDVAGALRERAAAAQEAAATRGAARTERNGQTGIVGFGDTDVGHPAPVDHGLAGVVSHRVAQDGSRSGGASQGGSERQRELATVILDGRVVGQILSEHMGRDASRPGAGTTFFDSRQGPAWTPSGTL